MWDPEGESGDGHAEVCQSYAVFVSLSGKSCALTGQSFEHSVRFCPQLVDIYYQV